MGTFASPSHESGDIVIVGNGIAGITAAVEARRLAPDKHIVMITRQSHPAIHTPALKQFAIGKLAREQLLAYPAGVERSQRIHVIKAHVEEIHPSGKFVRLSDGRAFGFGSLLLATGSTPIGLPAYVPGRDFDGEAVPGSGGVGGCVRDAVGGGQVAVPPGRPCAILRACARSF